MLDAALRPVKDRALAPLARGPIGRVHPAAISCVGMTLSVAAGAAAWQQLPALAVALWLLGRSADGLDGPVARERARATDLGGLIDIVADTVGYAAVPLGLAFAIDDRAGWIATAVLLATFYVNAVSWACLSALLEKRRQGAAATASPTSVALPRGLVEGTETIVFFTAALALPDAATTIWWIMAAAVAITALERIRWAASVLR